MSGIMKRARTKKGGLGCTIALVILVVIAVVAVFHFIGEKIVQIGEYLAIQNFSLYLAFTVFIVVAIIFHYFFIFRPLKRATSPEKSVIDYNDLVEHDKLELEPSTLYHLYFRIKALQLYPGIGCRETPIYF